MVLLSSSSSSSSLIGGVTSFLLLTLHIMIHYNYNIKMVNGHGAMIHPPTWHDPLGEMGMKSHKQCDQKGKYSGACMWFTNNTFIEGKPQLNSNDSSLSSLITYPGYESVFSRNPWYSPGTAKIFSPCGIVGGNPLGCPPSMDDFTNTICPGGGFGFGPDARNVDFDNVMTTNWKRGAKVKAAWSISANHGGGYIYRICKKPKNGIRDLTEECFQNNILSFSNDDDTIIQYGEEEHIKITNKKIPIKREIFKSKLDGSIWAKNPVPACGPRADGGFYDLDDTCPTGTQFPAPAEGVQGFGVHIASPSEHTFGFSIVDTLLVPSDLEVGEYILSFRWDCEQTPQVWNTCSNINIV